MNWKMTSCYHNIKNLENFEEVLEKILISLNLTDFGFPRIVFHAVSEIGRLLLIHNIRSST